MVGLASGFPHYNCIKPVKSLENLKSFLPITKWIGTYDKDKAIGDFTAGLTVALTVIPQSLAYANLAGLPVQYGLYSSFMGVFLYTILGTSKDVTLGPTAIMSLIVGQYGAMEWFNDPENPTDPRCAVLLSLMSGIGTGFYTKPLDLPKGNMDHAFRA